MKYMILRKRWVPGDDFVIWEKIAFAPTFLSACQRAKLPRVKFARGDLFGVIATEYVSDITRHFRWIGIATNKSSIRKIPDLLRRKDNWVSSYESSSAIRLMDDLMAPRNISRRQYMELTWQCIRPYGGWAVRDGVTHSAFLAIERYFSAENEPDMAAVTRAYDTCFAPTGSSIEATFLSHALRVFSWAIINPSADCWRNCNNAVQNILYGLQFGVQHQDYDREIKDILVRALPLQELLFSILERRLVRL